MDSESYALNGLRSDLRALIFRGRGAFGEEEVAEYPFPYESTIQCMHTTDKISTCTCMLYPCPFPVQVTLPKSMTPRRNHSAVVFGSGPSFRIVVFFGGYKLGGLNFIFGIGGFLSETTLLLLGECATSLWHSVHY